jgi:tRNA(fMet)-specific endonuclease VapC
MSDAYLLDTVAAVALLNGDSEIERVIEQADGIYLSLTVTGELFFGAANSAKVVENTEKVRQLVRQYVVLSPDLDTALEYGRIEAKLRRKGKPIPQNDIWIAALARQYEFILITRDKHFKEVDGLSTLSW